MSGAGINPTLIGGATLATGAAANNPDSIRKAATQFEAILIAQMLQSAHQADGDEEEESSALKELGEQQFAQAMANSGGIGIANMVMVGLTHANQRSRPDGADGETGQEGPGRSPTEIRRPGAHGK